MIENPINVESNKSHTKKIIAIVGGCVLVAGITTGSVYLLTRDNSDGDLEQAATVITNNTSSANGTGSTALQDGKNKITSGGTYTFTGSTTNGRIIVDTTDAVKIILDNVSITSSEGAAIKFQEGSNVTIELVGDNKITSTEDGINGEGDIKIMGSGKITINSGDDGIHADGLLEINGGTFDITAAEGLEATYVRINDGTINISATDDGINAGNKSDAYTVTIEINGGSITINMGQGDTDAIDSNGDLYINGGTLDITAQSPFDYDGTAKYNGGTMIVNGETTTEITNQFMDGGMMGGQGQGQQPQQSQQQPQQGGGRMMR